MNIIILGAGGLGRKLATTLSYDKHDVVIVDLDSKSLNNIREHLDVMTIQGHIAAMDVLKQAGIKHARLLIAATSDDTSNILACQIANHFKVKSTVCRLYSDDFFSIQDRFTPEMLGITDTIYPEEECIKKIIDTLENQNILEKIIFRAEDAMMTIFRIGNESPIEGIALKDFPDAELLKTVRFAAVVRNKKLMVPYGDTVLQPNDEVYLAGTKAGINNMISFLAPENRPVKKIIVAGASRMGINLARKLDETGFDVRVIENNFDKCEEIIDKTKSDMKVINGDPTNYFMLKEAGISECDVYIGVLENDEDNVLSCILAKKHGAKKVVATTKKSEYIEIIHDLDVIDCGFNTGLVAVNTVLRHLGTGTGKLSIDAVLHRVDAYVYEFEIEAGSELCNKKIQDCGILDYAVIALIFRNDGEVIVPHGSLELLTGDVIAIISTKETSKKLGKLFAKKGLFA